MSVGRYCSIGLCVLINLNVVLCSGQRLQQMSLSNGNVAYPENEEEDPAKQNAQVKKCKKVCVFRNFVAYFEIILWNKVLYEKL